MPRHLRRLARLEGALPPRPPFPARPLTAWERAVCEDVAERRGLPVAEVLALGAEALPASTPAQVTAAAERLARRRGIPVEELIREYEARARSLESRQGDGRPSAPITSDRGSRVR